MSFECMAWAVKQTAGGCPAKAVLMNLANTTNHLTGMCRPRIKLIAKETELSETTVKTALKALAEKGLLEVVPRFLEGQQLSNDYKMNMHGVGTDCAQGVARDEGVGREPTQGGSGADPGGSGAAPRITRREQEEETEHPPLPPKGGAPGGAGREKKSQVAHGLVDLWNQLAAEGTFPKARMTPPREGIFATRLKDPHWEADFRAAIAWIGTSPAAGWYRGENDRRWIADLDFMLQNGRATELAEKASVMDKAPEPAAAAPEAALPKWKTDRIAKCELAVTIAKRELTKLTAQGFTRATCPFRFKDADRELQKAQEALDAELGRPATESAATGPESGWDDE